MVWGAIRVVTTKNVVHAALWLVVVLGGVAAQYILAAAEFVAVSQVLVYIGAVMVLFLFGIMLTRATIGADTDLNNKGWGDRHPGRARRCSACSRYVVLDHVGDDVLVDRDEAQIAATTTAHQRRLPRRLPRAVHRPLVRPARRRHRRHRPGPEGLTRCTQRTSSCSSAVLFCIGVFGVIARRNAVMVLMSVELILNSVNLNLIAFALMNDTIDGHIFALFVIAVAAAEVGVGLAMVLMIYRNRRSIALDELSEMKG